MADIVMQRPRPGVKINLVTADVVNIIQQEEMLLSMTMGELCKVIEILDLERTRREQQYEKLETSAKG